MPRFSCFTFHGVKQHSYISTQTHKLSDVGHVSCVSLLVSRDPLLWQWTGLNGREWGVRVCVCVSRIPCLWVCAHINCMLAVNLFVCVCVCLCVGQAAFVCALAGGRLSEEAFRKALIAVPLLFRHTFLCAKTFQPHHAHRGNTMLIRDGTTAPNQTAIWPGPKRHRVHAEMFFWGVLFMTKFGVHMAFFFPEWKSSSWEYKGRY